jgi:hypothetical protein
MRLDELSRPANFGRDVDFEIEAKELYKCYTPWLFDFQKLVLERARLLPQPEFSMQVSKN